MVMVSIGELIVVFSWETLTLKSNLKTLHANSQLKSKEPDLYNFSLNRFLEMFQKLFGGLQTGSRRFQNWK